MRYHLIINNLFLDFEASRLKTVCVHFFVRPLLTVFQSGKIGVERPGLKIKNYMLMEISKDA